MSNQVEEKVVNINVTVAEGTTVNIVVNGAPVEKKPVKLLLKDAHGVGTEGTYQEIAQWLYTHNVKVVKYRHGQGNSFWYHDSNTPLYLTRDEGNDIHLEEDHKKVFQAYISICTQSS